MDIKELIDSVRCSCIWQKKIAVFKDNSGYLQFMIIKVSYNSCLRISVYNEKCDLTASVEVDKNGEKNFYLYNLYVEKDYRNLGIASRLCEVINYFLSYQENTCLIGVFEPFEFSKNRDHLIHNEKYEIIARKFYLKNDFEIVSYDDFLNNKEKYPELYRSNFGSNRKGKLIYKKIKETCQYNVVGKVLIHNNALSELDRINDILNPKTLKLN